MDTIIYFFILFTDKIKKMKLNFKVALQLDY